MKSLARQSFAASLIAALFMTTPAFAQERVLISGDEVRGPDNCIPFGGWTVSTAGSYTGFVYKNLPPFDLAPGDKIRFDASSVNDHDIVLDIALAQTVENGSDEPGDDGFLTVVTAGTPAAPRGDTIVGNFDLAFEVQKPFSFQGGGLIVRFKTVGTFLEDRTCTQVTQVSDAGDSSEFFVKRFFRDPDGAYPWRDSDDRSIGVIRFDMIAPRTSFQSVDVEEDTMLPIRLDATIPGGTTARFFVSSLPEFGALENVDSETGEVLANPVLYRPYTNMFGKDSFSWRAQTEEGSSATTGVDIEIRPVNDAPIAGDDIVSTVEEEPVFIDVLLNDRDVDGDTLRVTAVDEPTHGTLVEQAPGQLVYWPSQDFSGEDAFRYTVSDGVLETRAMITVKVGERNDAPYFMGATPDHGSFFRVTQGEQLRFMVEAADPDGTAPQLRLESAPLTSSFKGGVFTWSPIAGDGSTTVVFVLTDGDVTLRRSYPLIVSEAYVPTSPVGVPGEQAGCASTGTTNSPIGAGWLLGVLLLGWRRRRDG